MNVDFKLNASTINFLQLITILCENVENFETVLYLSRAVVRNMELYCLTAKNRNCDFSGSAKRLTILWLPPLRLEELVATILTHFLVGSNAQVVGLYTNKSPKRFDVGRTQQDGTTF